MPFSTSQIIVFLIFKDCKLIGSKPTLAKWWRNVQVNIVVDKYPVRQGSSASSKNSKVHSGTQRSFQTIKLVDFPDSSTLVVGEKIYFALEVLSGVSDEKSQLPTWRTFRNNWPPSGMTKSNVPISWLKIHQCQEGDVRIVFTQNNFDILLPHDWSVKGVLLPS